MDPILHRDARLDDPRRRGDGQGSRDISHPPILRWIRSPAVAARVQAALACFGSRGSVLFKPFGCSVENVADTVKVAIGAARLKSKSKR